MLMQLDKKYIEKLATEFTKYILLEECQKGKCFTTCYPLSIFLESRGIDTTLVQGYYKHGKKIHYWLILDDNKTIIDPTIKQFAPEQAQVIIGEYSDNYQNEHKLETLDTPIYRWQLPFKDNLNEMDKNSIEGIDAKAELIIILRAAIFLYTELEERILEQDLTEKEITYFYQIGEILTTFKSKQLVKELRPLLPNKFERLLEKITIPC